MAYSRDYKSQKNLLQSMYDIVQYGEWIDTELTGMEVVKQRLFKEKLEVDSHRPFENGGILTGIC